MFCMLVDLGKKKSFFFFTEKRSLTEIHKFHMCHRLPYTWLCHYLKQQQKTFTIWRIFFFFFFTFGFSRRPMSGRCAGSRRGGVEGVLQQDSPLRAFVTHWSQFSRKPTNTHSHNQLRYSPNTTAPGTLVFAAVLWGNPTAAANQPSDPDTGQHDLVKSICVLLQILFWNYDFYCETTPSADTYSPGNQQSDSHDRFSWSYHIN